MTTLPRKFLAWIVRAGRPYLAALWQDVLVAMLVATVLAVLIAVGACAPAVQQPARPPSPAAAKAAPLPGTERVIHITLQKSSYTPDEIKVRQGEAVVLELQAVDHDHGFVLAALGIHQDVDQGTVVRVHIRPTLAGSFEFHCDIYCGDFHEDMVGTLVVTPA